MSSLHRHTLRIGRAKRTAAARVDLSFEGEAVHVSLGGPAYRGRRFVRRTECSPDSTVVLEVRPRPAQLVFSCPPPDTVITCTDCPAPVGDRNYLAELFPAIPMTSVTREVRLRVRAPGYEERVLRLSVHPGKNEVAVELRRLGG